MKIAIIVPTYQRLDGTTPEFLKRALESIKNQTYQDYKVFLIGDKYLDDEEFISLSKIIDNDKLFKLNLDEAVERDKYHSRQNILWCCGGVNANNVGINEAILNGFEFIAHLDHDDVWYENHLQEIVNVINSNQNVAFVFTQAHHLNKLVLPSFPSDGEIIEHLPIQSNTIHSSICCNFKLLNNRYRDTYENSGLIYPSDADLWNRLGIEIMEKGLKSYLIKKITCLHDKEKV